MIVAWMWQALVVGTLVAVGAFGIDGLARLAGRPTRWGWVAALGLMVGLVAVAPFRTRASVQSTTRTVALPLSASQIPMSTSTSSPGHWSLPMLLDIPRAYLMKADGMLDRPVAWVEHHAPGVGPWILACWCVSTIGLLALLCAVEWRFRRARAGWPLADLHGTRVRVAPEVGPAVIGVRHPEIVVPRWLLARDGAAQRLVIAHEREHVQSGDPMLLAAGWAAVVLLPWHPAAWWMAARLRLAVEMDCDMRILRQGVVPRLYGTLLIDLAAECSGLGAGAPAFSDRPTQLERRLSAMMPTKPMVQRMARARGSLFALLGIAAIAVACEARMPTAADVQNMDASLATAAARRVGMVAPTGAVQYAVNGSRVSSDSARAVPSNSVSSIDLVRCQPQDTVAALGDAAALKSAAATSAANPCSGGTLIALTTEGQGDSFAPMVRAMRESGNVEIAHLDSVSVIDMVPLRRDVVDSGSSTTQVLHGTVAGVPVTRMNVIVTHAQGAGSLDSVARLDKSPLYILDGVKISEKRAHAMIFDSTGALGFHGGYSIESVEVIKGAAAMKLYSDPAAANGVIVITTKHE